MYGKLQTIMCGIVGFAGDVGRRSDFEHLVTLMADTLRRRGPDDQGVFVDPSHPLALGFRRLAIIDLTPTGHQPMTSRSGRWIVVFNGEIYNHRALRSDLESQGATFRGTSDTETLVEAIDCWGLTNTLLRTNGMFALAAWDTTDGVLFLARDRLGEKPLYWCHQGNRFGFSSELRALRTLPGLVFEIDPAAAASVLRWSFVPHPGTIYADVRQLPPGGSPRGLDDSAATLEFCALTASGAARPTLL